MSKQALQTHLAIAFGALLLHPYLGASYVTAVTVYFIGYFFIPWIKNALTNPDGPFRGRALLARIACCLATATAVAIAVWYRPPPDFPSGSNYIAALVAAIVAVPVWCVVLYALFILYSLLILPPIELVQGIVRAFQAPARQRESEQLSEARRNAEHEQQIRNDERQRQTATEHDRRVKARSDAELLFWQHVTELKTRFTKKMLDDYMQKYMGETHPAAEVERRGQQLQKIIAHHGESIHPLEKSMTIETLVDWYVVEKEKIRALPLDDELKDEFMVELDIRFSDLKQDLLNKMRP